MLTIQTGRPIELFGAAFRNGFVIEFRKTSPRLSAAAGERNAFAVGFNYAGSSWTSATTLEENQFLSRIPDSCICRTGSITNVAVGEPVPSDSKVTFK